HAGINSADAVCGARLGKRAAGEDHDQVLALLRHAGPDGAEIERDLRRLLPLTTKAEYDAWPGSSGPPVDGAPGSGPSRREPVALDGPGTSTGPALGKPRSQPRPSPSPVEGLPRVEVTRLLRRRLPAE